MVHRLYKDHLKDFKIAVLNCNDTIAVTLRSINQSKGKKDLEKWINDTFQMSEKGIKFKLAITTIEKAKLGIPFLADKLANENGKIKE